MELLKDSPDYFQSRLYNVGKFILYFFTATVIITNLALICGLTVSSVWPLVAFCLNTVLFVKKSEDIRFTIIIAALSLCTIAFFIAVSIQFYDFSWDGTAYHKAAVGALADGWNPYYQSLTNYNQLTDTIPNASEFSLNWGEVYPKAVWYLEASLYALIPNNIEAGKAILPLFMFVLFAYCKVLFTTLVQSKWFAYIIATIAVCNPISLAQLNTLYVDGIVSCLLLLIIIISIYLLTQKEKMDLYASLFCLILIGCNIKFSSLAFTGFFCVLFWVLHFFKYRGSKINSTKLFFALAVTAVVAIVFIGFNPYITNIVRYHTPFVGFSGESSLLGAENRALGSSIKAKYSSPILFLMSLFGKMAHEGIELPEQLFKLPFAISASEIETYSIPNPYFGGWGALFGLITIISSIIFAVAFCRWKHIGAVSKYFLAYSAVSVILLLALPGTNEARFGGFLYMIPISTMIILRENALLLKNKAVPISINSVLCVIILINILPWVGVQANKLKESRSINDTFLYLKNQITQGATVDLAILNPDFHALFYNIKDNGLMIHLVPYESVDDNYTRFYNWQMYYQVVHSEEQG